MHNTHTHTHSMYIHTHARTHAPTHARTHTNTHTQTHTHTAHIGSSTYSLFMFVVVVCISQYKFVNVLCSNGSFLFPVRRPSSYVQTNAQIQRTGTIQHLAISATKMRSKSILLSSRHDLEYNRQRTTWMSGLQSSHHRLPFIMRPAICVARACHIAPTLPESPQLVLAKMCPAHWVTHKITSRPRLCLRSCGSLIVSCNNIHVSTYLAIINR